MADHIPIDRVRKREQAGREPFESDKQKFTEKQAKLDRLASTENLNPIPEDESADHAPKTPDATTSDKPDQKPNR